MKQIFATIIVALLFASPAHASIGFTCEISDKTLKFVAGGYFPGEGGGFMNFHAEGQVLAPAVPDNLRKLNLTDGLLYSWLYTGDLRMRLSKEYSTEKTRTSAELVIQTTGNDDGGDWAGTYILNIEDTDKPVATVSFTGKAVCSIG